MTSKISSVTRTSKTTSKDARSLERHGRIRKPKNGAPMKQIFKGKEMSLSGKFMSCSKTATHEQIANWIMSHGGTFVTEVSKSTTHLICSIEDFKNRTDQVDKAWKLGKEKCRIVVFDWLEECLIRKNKRCRSERYWTLENTINRLDGKKKDMNNHEKRFLAERKRDIDPITDMRKEVNHIYYEPSGFEYKIVLTKVNLGNRMSTERYTLYLFESMATPHTYMFAAKYRSTARRDTSYFRDWCTPKFFDEAFKDFKTFFRLKTGYEWDYRLQGINIKKMFVYTPPEEGKPVGRVPMELDHCVSWEPVVESKEDRQSDEDTSMDDASEVDELRSNKGNLDNQVVTVHNTDSESGFEGHNSNNNNQPKIQGPTTIMSSEDVRYPVVRIFDEESFESSAELERCDKF